MASAAAAWALLLEPAASLLAPLLRGPDLWALSVASRCKEFGHAWRQLAHVNHWAAGLAQALGSGKQRLWNEKRTTTHVPSHLTYPPNHFA